MPPKGKKTSTAKSKEKELEKVHSQVPATAEMFEGDAGTGFEDTGIDDYAMPFLVVLQKNSPQVDKDDPRHVDGAESGMFFNTATGQVYGESVDVVPVHYERKFAEWVPRDEGGGFRGHHDPESDYVQRAMANRDDRGRFLTPNGTYLMDTRYHFVMILDEDTGSVEQAVLALSSTQIKKSRLWMTAMRKLKMTTKDGRSFTPPMFSHIYRLTTVPESNDQGTWRGITHAMVRSLANDELNLYQSAKMFKEQVAAGKVRVDDAAMTSTASNDEEDVPF